MSDAAEILKSVQIGLNVVIFLLNTDRGLQATELCNECVILLQNLDSGSHLDISDVLFNAYYAISGYTDAERHTNKILGTFIYAGILTTELGQKYVAQSRFPEAKQLYKGALNIWKTIGHERKEVAVHLRLGCVCAKLSEYQKAKEYHEKALAIAIEIGDRNGEGKAYGSLANVFFFLGENLKAKEYYEKALAIAIEIGDRNGEQKTYGNLGALFVLLSEYQKAKEYLDKALAIAVEDDDRYGEGETRQNLGSVFSSLSEYQKAKDYYEKALAITIEIGDRNGEGAAYRNLGTVFHYLGELQKVKEYFEKALAIFIEIGDRYGEGTTLGSLGLMFHSFGKYQRAKEYHEKALAIEIEIGNRNGEKSSYCNLGHVFDSLGEYEKAKEYHEKALAIEIETGHRKGEESSYLNLGIVCYCLGEYQKAKEYHEKALAIAIEIGDRNGEETAYRRLGCVFYSLGEYQKAKEYLEKALGIAIEIGKSYGEGFTYSTLGYLYSKLNRNLQAKEHLDKAVGVAITLGDRELEAIATVGLASVFASVNDSQKAKEHCEKALTISRECGDRNFVTELYQSLGFVFQSLGEYGKAADYLQKACSISCQTGDKMNEFLSLLGITVLKISQSESVEAMEYLLQCIGKYEQIRTLQRGNSGFQISLLEEHGTFPYKLLTDFLCGTGKFRDALYVEELGRARVLSELMADKYSVESHISADPQSWFGIENIVKRESNSVFLYISYADRQVLLWLLKANGDVCFRKTDEVKVETLIAEQVCEVEGVFKKSATCFGVLPAANCEDRSLDDNVATFLHEESQANLRGDETKDTGRSHHLCYQWIVAPVADLLTEPEIIIVPDRFSYRVPFAVLRDEPAGRYLSEEYRIRIVPSLTTLRLIQECPGDYHSQTGALVVGDPTVGEVYYSGRLTDITPLFCASKEAEVVGQLLGVQPLLGSRATKPAVLEAVPSVSLIHLAAHGHPERGEIALSPQRTANSIPQEEDYLLTMSDIEGVQVRAKLVVLSCCHSGRGLIKKEGVIGIARAFLASGARSVLVASWAVEDEATANLMKHFYKHLVRGESASESLHQAVQWLRSNGFPKPRQWAPFVLLGDNVTIDFSAKG